jgi:hypothetical protein
MRPLSRSTASRNGRRITCGTPEDVQQTDHFPMPNYYSLNFENN